MKHAHILNEKEAARLHRAAARIMELVTPLMSGNGVTRPRRRRRAKASVPAPTPPSAKPGRKRGSGSLPPEPA